MGVAEGDLIVGRYFERVERIERVESPTAEILEYSLVDFRVTRFLLRAHEGLLELEDAPRGFRGFLDALEEVLGGSTRIGDASTSVWSLADGLRKHYDACVIARLTFANVPVSPEVRMDQTFQGEIGFSRAAQWVEEMGEGRLASLELALRRGGQATRLVVGVPAQMRFLNAALPHEVDGVRSVFLSCWRAMRSAG